MRLWDLATGGVRHVLRHRAPVRHVVMTPSGHLVTAGDSGRARWWDATTGAQLGLPFGHSGGITTLTVLNGAVISTADDGTIIRSRAESAAVVTDEWARPGPAILMAAGWSDQLVTWDAAGRLRWLEGRPQGESRPPGVTGEPLSLHPDAAGSAIVLVHTDGVVAQQPPTSAGDATDRGYLRQLVIRPDGFVVMGSPDRVLQADNAEHGEWFSDIVELAVGVRIATLAPIAVAADTNRVGGRARDVGLHDEPTTSLVGELSAPLAELRALADRLHPVS